MNTVCRLAFQNASDLSDIPDKTVALVVTSPPYPMIEMWDELFCSLDPQIGLHLKKQEGRKAYEKMHLLLDMIWKEVYRVLIPGGIACINIGDATRSVGGDFSLYPNHARILGSLADLGFYALPEIIWRKQTNAPNKFMGSGMYPAGAYVTLEHEFILVVRKGGKREFPGEKEKLNRRKSAFFWEERNNWFSDVWMDIKGASQVLAEKETRKRNASFPYEVPYRLVAMYSVMGDTVLDPFLGAGTTCFAAMALGRNSIGFELDKNLAPVIQTTVLDFKNFQNLTLKNRLMSHMDFIHQLCTKGASPQYTNKFYGFPVKTRQELDLWLPMIRRIGMMSENRIEIAYHKDGTEEIRRIWLESKKSTETGTLKKVTVARNPGNKKKKKTNPAKAVQRSLF